MLLEDQKQNLEGAGLLDYCPSLEGWIEASGTIRYFELEHLPVPSSPIGESENASR